MIRIATAPVSPRRAYRYDTPGRPTSRTLARQGTTRNDVFTYNDRSESPRRLVGGLDKTADGVRRVSLWRSRSPAKQGEGTMGCARSKPRSAFAPQGRAGNGVPASQLISDVVDDTDLNGWDYDRAAAASSSGVASRPVLKITPNILKMKNNVSTNHHLNSFLLKLVIFFLSFMCILKCESKADEVSHMNDKIVCKVYEYIQENQQGFKVA